jgi:UDP-N-acetylmuramoylalanine--D-glutamate ligase
MFERETALVVGLGRSGLAAAKALRANGASVVASDEKPRAALREEIDAIEAMGARFAFGEALDEDLLRADFAVVSPGVPPSSPLVQRIGAAGIPAIGEVELAYRLCSGPIVAVTGTKGKSTTTALIGHLLRACGRDVRVGGNIGEPLVAQISGAGPQTWCVAEVSSFQLESIVRFRPRISVVLNVAPDHLDRYSSMEAYAAAKFRIFENQRAGDTAVIDLDDPLLAALLGRLERNGVTVRGYTLGDAPLNASDIPLLGEHNVRNVTAALLAAGAAGCDFAEMRRAVRSFSGLPHRLQQVGEIDGVLYVDDSKATNPQSTVAALRAFERPLILIAGGRAKGTDFDALGSVIRERARRLVAIGEAADALIGAAQPVAYDVAASIEEAVARAAERASPGDVVLLSPACASFDMFVSAEERGERFARAVRSLQEAVHAQ